MVHVDCERLACELVRALRGRRSQLQLSRRLGHRSNVFYPWERGTRAPTASGFFRLARVTGCDVAGKMRTFARERVSELPDLETREGVAGFLESLSADRSIIDLARATGNDRTTLSRWLRGRTEPRLPELLGFVEAATQRLVEFVTCFVAADRLPAVAAAHATLEVQRRLAYEAPLSHAILRALELERVRAQAGPAVVTAVAQAVGLSEQEVAALFGMLCEAGQVERDAEGRYRVANVLTVDTQPDPEQNRRLKAHWAALALARLSSGEHAPEALLSYNLFTVSERDFQRLRRMHIEHFERVRELVGEAKGGGQRVVLMNLQLLPLGVPGA